jgi:DNA-binding NarL/FixJ family response regulator
MAQSILLLVPDLFFQARLETAARRLGLKVVHAADWKSALEAARKHVPAAAVIDLGASAAAGPFKFLEKLRSEEPLKGIRTLGFLEHVRKDLAEKARKAGCGTIAPKGGLSQDTPAYLRKLTAGILDLAPAKPPVEEAPVPPAPKRAPAAPPAPKRKAPVVTPIVTKRPVRGRKRDEEEE